MARDDATKMRQVPPVRSRPGRKAVVHYWLPAILVGAGVHVAAFALLAVSPRNRELRAIEPDVVRWVGERIDDALDVRDPKAIVLPTRWNAAMQESGKADNRGSGEIFPLEDSPVIVKPGESPPGLVVMPEGPRTASVALRTFARPVYSAFGQKDTPAYQVPERAALIEIRDVNTGSIILRQELRPSAITAVGADSARWLLWAPFEMLLAVEPTGALGPPLVVSPGSGVEQVDAFFRNALRSLVRPDLVLPAGYYRVAIGP